ncbi:nicotinate phosphoribosyltransferase [Nitrosospira multiformis ATCC 25196]|uniref:Nicotinate phosphoribosyltransferase n=1 Tax=Nitrosospira multiformis (strain ATCC 25196 / NCIMB 11849 / C 71) TaxID=323848 RepID=Q2YAL1_NITMU|nr:nicotinate phosphoribosyltransferase [Nitrosospira multiformis]ABB74210.1 Nicotinate phosphoribosyltransferase related protein [Nitrosospira multiformis ATCC 25196]SEF47644.1 nicotinate phosphoribosyltransferase [Nitrosospira multiformis ATCC 25196]
MNPLSSPLLTDHYQLTMLESYLQQGMQETAVFELFFRKLPPTRNFLVAAGLEQALEFLENLHFSAGELTWLKARFGPALVNYLEQFRFTGDVDAMPEGTLFFPDEPILRITAPLPQAQFVESRIINLLHFETLIASKAARSVLVAPGKLLVDFGMRRAHGAEAALLAARASYLAGFSGTSTVLAAAIYGMPSFGTVAHSYIQAHTDETAAFEHLVRCHPKNSTLLIDTYDTEAAAIKVVALARKLAPEGIEVSGVRLDSGDLGMHARRVRRILDEGRLEKTRIFASGNLNENRVHELISSGAPIDGFGVGTALDVSSDAPALDCAYKLQEYAGKARRKRSEGKATWPGRKQVYRKYDPNGQAMRDVIALEKDDSHEGEPLIVPVMRNGRRIEGIDGNGKLEAIRRRTVANYARLPEPLRSLETASAYPVEISPSLQALAKQVDDECGLITSTRNLCV